MTKQMNLGGSFTLPNTSITVNRLGYGAMQLAGPQVWGPLRDLGGAVRVLRHVVDAGVNHIDTSDYYGPHVTNQIIKQALHPYPENLVIVTKVGFRRGADKSWMHALSRKELIDAVHDNLRNLGLERMDVVNLRVGGDDRTSEEPIEGPLEVDGDQYIAVTAGWGLDAQGVQNGIDKIQGTKTVVPKGGTLLVFKLR